MKRKFEVRKNQDGKMAIFSLTTGEQISQWFDEIYFSLRLERMGYYLAKQGKKWAIFDLRGNQISDWFDKIDHAGETFYLAKINKKWYMYDYSGHQIPFNFKKLSLEWFDEIKPLTGDLYLFRKDWKYAIFNYKTGEKLSDWFDGILTNLLFSEDKYYIGIKGKEWAIYDLDGRPVSRDFSIEILKDVKEIRFDNEKGILELLDENGNIINRIK